MMENKSWQHHRVNGAIVEGEWIDGKGVLHGAKERKEVRMAKPKITREQAEAKATGRVGHSELYFVSRGSPGIFEHLHITGNPYWVMSHEGGIDVVDAVTGRYLGEAIPPPSQSRCISGPFQACPNTGYWKRWIESADRGLHAVTGKARSFVWPTKDEVIGSLMDPNTTAFYECAHGHWLAFVIGEKQSEGACAVNMFGVPEINAALLNRPKIPFSFLSSCNAMDQTGPGTMAHALTKGCAKNCAIVGHSYLSKPENLDAWINSVRFQDSFFGALATGITVKEAHTRAIFDYPMCEGVVLFHGDPTFAGPWERSFVRLRTGKQTYRAGELITVMVDCDPPGQSFYPFLKVTKGEYTRYVTIGGKLYAEPVSYYPGIIQSREPQISSYVLVEIPAHHLGGGKYQLECGLVSGTTPQTNGVYNYLGPTSKLEITVE